MKKYLLFVIPLFLYVSCKDKNATVETKEGAFPLAKSEYTVLPFTSRERSLFEKDVRPSELSDKELIEIEGLLQKMMVEYNAGQARALAKHNKENPKNQWKETGYELETKGFKRQYLPVINEKGEKEVWIHFFCTDLEIILGKRLLLMF